MLQNNGKFDQSYYFKLADDITSLDCKNSWIPPIGTKDHPFVGNFDGNNKVIQNLRITTDQARTNYEPSSMDFYSGVGFFGIVGNGTTRPHIQNLYLDDCYVLNDGHKTMEGTHSPTGLVFGVLETATINAIGVNHGRISTNQITRPVKSLYTLVGLCNDTSVRITRPDGNQSSAPGESGDLLIDGLSMREAISNGAFIDVNKTESNNRALAIGELPYTQSPTTMSDHFIGTVFERTPTGFLKHAPKELTAHEDITNNIIEYNTPEQISTDVITDQLTQHAVKILKSSDGSNPRFYLNDTTKTGYSTVNSGSPKLIEKKSVSFQNNG